MRNDLFYQQGQAPTLEELIRSQFAPIKLFGGAPTQVVGQNIQNAKMMGESQDPYDQQVSLLRSATDQQLSGLEPAGTAGAPLSGGEGVGLIIGSLLAKMLGAKDQDVSQFVQGFVGERKQKRATEQAGMDQQAEVKRKAAEIKSQEKILLMGLIDKKTGRLDQKLFQDENRKQSALSNIMGRYAQFPSETLAKAWRMIEPDSAPDEAQVKKDIEQKGFDAAERLRAAADKQKSDEASQEQIRVGKAVDDFGNQKAANFPSTVSISVAEAKQINADAREYETLHRLPKGSIPTWYPRTATAEGSLNLREDQFDWSKGFQKDTLEFKKNQFEREFEQKYGAPKDKRDKAKKIAGLSAEIDKAKNDVEAALYRPVMPNRSEEQVTKDQQAFVEALTKEYLATKRKREYAGGSIGTFQQFVIDRYGQHLPPQLLKFLGLAGGAPQKGGKPAPPANPNAAPTGSGWKLVNGVWVKG